jgi:hypothetical protein
MVIMPVTCSHVGPIYERNPPQARAPCLCLSFSPSLSNPKNSDNPWWETGKSTSGKASERASEVSLGLEWIFSFP